MDGDDGEWMEVMKDGWRWCSMDGGGGAWMEMVEDG